jgi:DNA-binding PadR family transcriptional regulator
MELSPTSFALLGLLSLRPWTTYELAQQLTRSLRWFFPRAERHLYTEVKRLADAGLASAEVGFTGRRRSTTCAITPAAAGAAGRLQTRHAPRPGGRGAVRTFAASGRSQDRWRPRHRPPPGCRGPAGLAAMARQLDGAPLERGDGR